MTSILSVQDLNVTLGPLGRPLQAVRDVSLDLASGETLCIVGESGCGKSMLSLALMGLLPRSGRRSAGRLALSGTSLLELSDREMGRLRGARMAMIFQEPMTSLNPVYTIGEQLVETYRRHRSGPVSAARGRAIEMLERVGISSAAQRMRQYPHQLSGGLRQRVMIAMALMCSPDLLIADEPTTALDVTIQTQILHLLAELQAEFGMGMILVTHDLGVVARVADRVAVMYAGTVIETAPARELFARPTHPYTQGLLSCLPSGQMRGRRLGTIPGTVPARPGEQPGCSFRNRCPLASPLCEVDPLPRRRMSPTHEYVCAAPEEALRAGNLWTAEGVE